MTTSSFPCPEALSVRSPAPYTRGHPPVDGCPGHYAGRLSTMTAPSPYRTRRGPAAGDPKFTRPRSCGAVRCSVRFHDPLTGAVSCWLAACVSPTNTAPNATWRDIRFRHCSSCNNWKLEFRQFSFHHAHLVLIHSLHRDYPTAHLFPTCYGPVSLSGFQPALAGTGKSGGQEPSQQVPFFRTLLLF